MSGKIEEDEEIAGEETEATEPQEVRFTTLLQNKNPH
jgi:hypothetical protein